MQSSNRSLKESGSSNSGLASLAVSCLFAVGAVVMLVVG
jgi:hypothetical protein